MQGNDHTHLDSGDDDATVFVKLLPGGGGNHFSQAQAHTLAFFLFIRFQTLRRESRVMRAPRLQRKTGNYLSQNRNHFRKHALAQLFNDVAQTTTSNSTPERETCLLLRMPELKHHMPYLSASLLASPWTTRCNNVGKISRRSLPVWLTRFFQTWKKRMK